MKKLLLILLFPLALSAQNSGSPSTITAPAVLLTNYEAVAPPTLDTILDTYIKRLFMYSNGTFVNNNTQFEITLTDDVYLLGKGYMNFLYALGAKFTDHALTVSFPKEYLDSSVIDLDSNAMIMTSSGSRVRTVFEWIDQNNIKIVDDIVYTYTYNHLGQRWTGEQFHTFMNKGEDYNFYLFNEYVKIQE